MTSTTSKLVIAFFTLILGIVLIGTIADSGSLVTTKYTVNETLDISSLTYGTKSTLNITKEIQLANYPTGWKTTDCPITSLVIYNNTGTKLTITTDYTFTASNGSILFKNTTNINQTMTGSNLTNVGYTYCGDDYMNIAWGRSILNLVAGFFALGILGVGIGLFYSIAKDAGIIGK